MSGEKSSSQMAFHEPPLLSPKLPLSKGPIPLLPAPVPSSARSGDGWQPDKTDGFIVGASWVTFVTILGTSLSLNAQSPCPQAHPALTTILRTTFYLCLPTYILTIALLYHRLAANISERGARSLLFLFTVSCCGFAAIYGMSPESIALVILPMAMHIGLSVIMATRLAQSFMNNS